MYKYRLECMERSGKELSRVELIPKEIHLMPVLVLPTTSVIRYFFHWRYSIGVPRGLRIVGAPNGHRSGLIQIIDFRAPVREGKPIGLLTCIMATFLPLIECWGVAPQGKRIEIVQILAEVIGCYGKGTLEVIVVLHVFVYE